MHGLLDVADRRIRKDDRSLVSHRVIEGRGYRKHDHCHREVNRAAVTVDIRDVDLYHVGPGREVRGQVYRHITLCHVQHGLGRTTDRDAHRAVAGGYIIFFRGPENSDRALITLCDGAREPAGPVGNGDLCVVAGTAATTSASPGEGTKRSGYDFIIGCEIQVAVFYVSIVHLALGHEPDQGDVLVQLVQRVGGFSGFILSIGGAFHRLRGQRICVGRDLHDLGCPLIYCLQCLGGSVLALDRTVPCCDGFFPNLAERSFRFFCLLCEVILRLLGDLFQTMLGLRRHNLHAFLVLGDHPLNGFLRLIRPVGGCNDLVGAVDDVDKLPDL